MKKNVILAMSLVIAMSCGSVSAFATETAQTTPLTKVEDTATEQKEDKDAADKDAATEKKEDKDAADKDAATEKKEDKDAADKDAATEKKEDQKSVPMTKLVEAAPAETPKVEVSFKKADLPVVNDVVFVSLRDSASALKLNIAWDAKTRTATVSSDVRSMKLTDGKDVYASTTTIPGAVGMPQPMQLGAAPFINKEGKMYIPAKAYTALVGYDVTITDTDVVIAKQMEAKKEETLPTDKKDEKVEADKKDEKVEADKKDEKVEADKKDEKVEADKKDEKVEADQKDEKVEADQKDNDKKESSTEKA